MSSLKRTARIAGWIYLLMALPAPFALIYVPATLVVRGDAQATASNVLGREMLYRSGIVVGLASAVGFILLAVALHRLLSGVHRSLALLMVTLMAASATIAFLNEASALAALTLFHGPDYLSVFDATQRDALGLLFLGMRQQGIFINEMLWGLWLFPFGALVMRSGFIPKILGILLLVNGGAYVVASLTALLVPSTYNTVFLAAGPALLGELWMMLWLLIKGVRQQPLVPVLAGGGEP